MSIRRRVLGVLAAFATMLTACVSLPEQVRDEFECEAHPTVHQGGDPCARD